MTKLRENIIFGEFEGNAGNKTIAKTKYGKQLKDKPGERGIITEGQQNGMNDWGYISSVYDTLTEKEVMQWVEKGKDRDIRRMYTKEKYLDGRNLFFSVNRKRLEIGMPIIKTIPKFSSTQGFVIIRAELVTKGDEKDILLIFNPGIEDCTLFKIMASSGVKENLTFIHPNLCKTIGMLDSSFKSGDSILQLYLDAFKQLPEPGLKIGFEIEPINKDCGSTGMHFKNNVHFFKPADAIEEMPERKTYLKKSKKPKK
jgi:hypothetical protein